MTRFTESVVEEAALAWLEAIDYEVLESVEIAPGELQAERIDYKQVVLERRLPPCSPRPPWFQTLLPSPSHQFAFIRAI